MNAPDIGIEANLRQITTALVSRCAPSPTNPRLAEKTSMSA